MIQAIKNIFKRKNTDLSDYNGLADFILHAPDDLKKKVMTDAAKKANEDQLKVFNEAKFKIKIN